MTGDAAAIEAWLTRRVAQELGRAPEDVDPDQPFAGLGLDSTAAVSLTGELEELLERRVDPMVVFEFPTIRRLAAHLGAPGGAP